MLTITIPFSGKEFCLERVFKSLRNLDYPEPYLQYVFIDNSGKDSFYNKLQSLTQTLENTDKKFIFRKPQGHYTNVAEIYNDLVLHVKGNWFALEDDVIELPKDTLTRMYREINQRPELAVLGAHMESRRGWPGPLTWKVEMFHGKPGLRPVSPAPYGLGFVDAVHTGCTLIRPSAYRDYIFRQTGQNEQILGHDIYLGIDTKQKNLEVAVLWDLRPGHATETGVLFPKMPLNLEINPQTLRPTNPLVSVITPTASRPQELERLIQNLQKQTYPHYEHLICQDGPCRFTANSVEKNGDLRTRYYELGFTHSFSGAPQRNAMLQKVGGDLVVFVDDDAEIYEDYLQTMVALWKEGNPIGFAQIEHTSPGQTSVIIPNSKTDCGKVGQVDTLCFYIDNSLARSFFWDLKNEHDHRFVNQILEYTKGACGFVNKVVGKSSRQWGKTDLKTKPSVAAILHQLTRNLNSPSPEAEPLILTDPIATLQYIINAKGATPWPAAEEILITHIPSALFYSQNILRRRFPLLESVLVDATLPELLTYTRQNKVRWDQENPLLHQKILTNPASAMEYAEIHPTLAPEVRRLLGNNPLYQKRLSDLGA